MKEKIEELSKSFATIESKLKTVSADDYTSSDKMKVMMEDLMYAMSNIHSRINYITEDFYKYTYDHGKGHLPKIKSSSQMMKALKACGMEDDYEVEVPSIYISASSANPKNKVLNAAYIKKK